MKRILIIGDSWAIVPANLYSPQSLWCHHYAHQQKDHNVLNWLDFQLLQRGHSVSNRSYGGNANWFQLGIAETYIDAAIKNNYPIDMIIWFHTEVLRDGYLLPRENNRNLKTVKDEGFESLIDKVAIETYEYATQLYNKNQNIKWVIIGGHAPVRKSLKHMLGWADMMIEDWRSDILGMDIPECHSLSVSEKDWEYLKDHCNLSIDVILDELNKKQFILEACSNTDLFYDGVHPSPNTNAKLAEKIIKYYNL